MAKQPMSDKSIIIIGAGLAGLSTGCYGQMNGYRTRIFEHHTQPGGVAAAWRRKNYLIDGGIHFLMGYKPETSLYHIYEELGIIGHNRLIELIHYFRLIDEKTGQALDITSDLDKLAQDLKALSPTDSRLVDELIAGARGVATLDMFDMGLDKPPELTGFMDKLKQMWRMRKVMKYFSGRYNKSIAEYAQAAQNPLVRQIISNLFLPEVPVWFVFMILGMLANKQAGLLADGSLAFARSIEKRYNDLGGEISYKSTVEKVLVENDKAVGVKLIDGSEHRADAVISAADGYSTVFQMLNGKYTTKLLDNMYKTWPIFTPYMMVNFGVAKEFPDKPSFNTIFLKQPITIGNRQSGGIFIRLFNYSNAFAPTGKTVVQASAETDWEFWENLYKTDRARYDATKADVAAEMLRRLEPHLPGISDKVDVTDVATPYTLWRYTRNHHGSFEGWLPTKEAIMTPIPRTLPGLNNFYMAGQWVMAGGGVPPCLISGRHAVQLVCHKDKKQFSAATN